MSNFTDLAPGLEQQLLAPVTQEPRQEPRPVVAPLAPGLAEQFGLRPDPAAAEAVDQDRERRLQQSFREAFNTDPEFQAEALRHAGELGVTRAAAAAHPEIAQRMLAQRALQYQELRRTYPTLLEKFSNVDFAAVAHDDIGNLKATETSWERLGRNFDVGRDANKRGYLGVRQALGWLTPDEQVELDRINVNLRGSSGEKGIGANTAQMLGQMSETVPLAMGAGATASGIAALGGPGVAGTAFTVGTAAAGFSMTSVIEGGNAYLDMVDRGIEPSVAAKAAFGVVGPVNGALEVVGMHYFAAPFKGAFSRFAGKAIAGKLASQTGSAAFSQFAREYAKSHLAEVGTEILQEVVSMSAAGVARRVSTPDAPEQTWSDIFGQLADIGAKTSQGMALIALPGPSFHYVADSIRARQSLLEQEFLKSAAANEGESKLAKRSPNLRLEYLAATARGSDGQTAYIRTADALDQLQQAGLTIDDLRAKAPDIAERLAVARAAGAEDTAFSTSSYIGKLQNTEFGKVLEPYLRLSENSMPLVELREFAKQDKKLSAEAQQLLDTYRQLGEEWDASAKQVREAAVDSLLAAGKTREEAGVLATYLQSFAVTQAHAAQQMPHEWFAAHPLVTQSAAQTEQGAGVQQGEALRTDTPEFRAWFGESAVVDENGAPLVVYHGTDQSFDAFDSATIGNASGNDGLAGRGFYFTRDKAAADAFSGGDGGRTIEAFLSLRNPVVLQAIRGNDEHVDAAPLLSLSGWTSEEAQLLRSNGAFDSGVSGDRIRQVAEAAGYDGIVLHRGSARFDEVVAFRPEQIKSTSNRGTFDPADPNILHQPDKGKKKAALQKRINRSQGAIAAAATRKAKALQDARAGKLDLLAWIALNGGMRRGKTWPGSTLPEHLAVRGWGIFRVFNERSPTTWEEMAVSAREDGWFPEQTAEAGGSWSAERFVNAVGDAVDGTRILHPNAMQSQAGFEGEVDRSQREIEEVEDQRQQSFNDPKYWRSMAEQSREIGDADAALYEEMRAEAIEAGQELPEDYFTDEMTEEQRIMLQLAALAARLVPAQAQEILDEATERGWTDAVTIEFLEDAIARAKQQPADVAPAAEVGSSDSQGEAPGAGVDGGPGTAAEQPEAGPAEGVEPAPQPARAADVARPAAAEKIARATPSARPPRGTFDPSRMLITLGKKADFSTWLHESAHYFLHVFAQVATEPTATEQQRADLDALLRWFKVAGETPEERAAAWSSMTLAEQEKGHETFAYNWEIYLHTGEAPSAELRSIFEQFRVWLMSVYTNIRDTLGAIYRDKFGTELPMLTGEVRQVMNRLLAAEDKISKAEAVRSMVPMFQTEEQSGMTPEEWAAYQAVVAEAHAAAVTDLSKASIKQMQWLSGAVDRITRELQRKNKDARDAVELEVAQAVEAEPLYRAMRWLSKGELRGEDGEMVQAERDVNHKLDRAAVLRLFPGRDLAAIDGMVVEGGIAPDVAADALGFDSGAALVQQLLEAPGLEARIEADADALMQQRFGDMNSAEAREAAVEDALHNEARARFVAVELKFLEKSVAPVRQMVAAAREAARRAINEMPVRQLTPRTFALAEARAAKKVLQLAAKKDKAVEAIEAKRQQLLMSQMTAEAITARAEVEKAKASFARFFKPDEKIAKTRTVDIVAAARSILAWYGFGNSDRTPASYVEQLRTYNPTLYAELEPTIARVLNTPMDYRDLTTEEFRGLEATVDALWDSAKRDHLVMVAGKALELEEVTQELQARLLQMNPAQVLPGQTGDVTKRQKMVRGIQNLGAMLKRVEHWTHTMDGAEAGPFTRYIWRPISQAIDAYREQRNKLVKQYVELLRGIDLPVGRIDAHEIGYTFGADNGSVGKATLLGALLHTGNESNKRKLLLAEERQWATLTEDGELDTTQWDAFVQRMIDEGVLTKKDFAWLQKVWDLLEGTKKQTQDAWHEINGFRMKEVKAQPFTVTFPDGSTETYRGGYVPAKVDADMVRDAAVHAKMDALEGDQRSSFPSTATGFGKNRKEGYLHALSLDVRKIAAHIDQVVRFAHVQPAVRDVMRILRNKQTAGLLGRVDPTAIEELLLPWLNRAAQQQTMDGDPRSLVNRFWSAVRKRTGMGTMFLNLSNAMQQLTGYFPSSLRVKPRYLGAAFAGYVRDHKAVTAAAVEASKFMAHRLDNQTFDVADAMNDLLVHPSKWDKIHRWSNRHAYVLQSAFQGQVDVVTWTAAYNQALEELGPQMSDAEATTEAVARADAAVRLTQGSLAPEDLAKFEASTPFVKVWTQFSGYFNMLANLNASEYRKLFRDLGWGAFGKKGLARLAGIYVLGFAAPMLISDAIAKTMAGKWDDEDDDGYSDDLAQWFFSSQAKGLAGMVPAFGPAIAKVVSGIASAAQYDDRMSTAPGITALEAATFGVARAVDQVKDGRISGRGVRDVLTLLSLLSGLPVQVLGKPAGYLVDVGTGAAQPTGPVDAVRGLITGVK